MTLKTDLRRRELPYLIAAIASAATIVACGGGGGNGSAAAVSVPASPGTPVANVSTSALTYAPVVVGALTMAQQVTISNSGASPLTISAVTTTSGGFLTPSGTCSLGASIPTGGSCTIDVVFAPSSPGAVVGTLLVSHNATPSTSIVSLSAFATAAELSAGSHPLLVAADCTRLLSGNQAIAALTIQDADMQQVADMLKTTNPAHAYQVFARAPLNVMWWLRSQGGSINMVTVGAAVHESNHEIDTALRLTCNTDRIARLLLNGAVQRTDLVTGNGSTANYSIAGETVPAALKSGLRYATYITGAASASGNDFPVLLDELNAYTGATEFEVGLLSDPVFNMLRANGDFNAGGQADFMLYALAYLKAARLNHPSSYAAIKSQAGTLQYIQTVWTQAEANLAALYPFTLISGAGGIVISKDTLAAAYSSDFLAELDLLGIAHQPASAWATTYLR